MRIRTARKAAQYFREIDPNSDITEYMIRTLMESGELPTFRNGYKKLTSIEAIEDYLNNKLGGDAVVRKK